MANAGAIIRLSEKYRNNEKTTYCEEYEKRIAFNEYRQAGYIIDDCIILARYILAQLL